MNDDQETDETGIAGPCCACGAVGRPLNCFVQINKKMPEPGTGWGCFICGLPMDGALAAICSECANALRAPTHIVVGFVHEGRRVPISDLNEEFHHIEAHHVGATIH